MSVIFAVDPRTGVAQKIGFATLVTLIKGTAIVSLADSDEFVEFGLSERLMIRIASDDDEDTLRISIFSTLNSDDVVPARLQLINDGEEPTANLLERRLHSLRQVYAILLMLDTGRGEQLAGYLRKDPEFDLERWSLKEDEHLLLQAAGPGSWWVTALTRLKGAPEQALNGLSLIYGEGRSLLLERVRAGTKIRQQAAERDEDQRIIELSKALDKVKDPVGKAAIRQRLLSELESANPRLAAPTIAGLLAPPDNSDRPEQT